MKKEIPAALQTCITFHGHLCPGLTIGYLAAQIGMRSMKLKRAADEELVCIAMSDGCAVDAIQHMTGCTLGKGNLIFQDYGKMVFLFLKRTKGNFGSGIRIALKGFPQRKRRSSSKPLTKEEAALSMLTISEEKLFAVRRLKKYPLPEQARIFTSQPCACCAEPTMEPRLRVKDCKLLCPECYHDEYSRGW